MNNTLMVRLPESLESYSEDLLLFFNAMVKKLAKNAHKSTPQHSDIQRMTAKMLAEVVEFMEQHADNKFDSNTLYELADASNFAFLMSVVLRREGTSYDA